MCDLYCLWNLEFLFGSSHLAYAEIENLIPVVLWIKLCWSSGWYQGRCTFGSMWNSVDLACGVLVKITESLRLSSAFLQSFLVSRFPANDSKLCFEEWRTKQHYTTPTGLITPHYWDKWGQECTWMPLCSFGQALALLSTKWTPK